MTGLRVKSDWTRVRPWVIFSIFSRCFTVRENVSDNVYDNLHRDLTRKCYKEN